MEQNREIKLRAMTPAERLYAQRQSRQISNMTGCVGCLQVPAAGEPVWRDEYGSPRTAAFDAALAKLADTLRDQPASPEGLRADAEGYAYLIVRDADQGAYQIYGYQGKCLDRHRKEAEQGIRFITQRYQEQFRIPDGDMVRILCPDRRMLDRVCRFVDSCHLEVGDGLYHVCELAERMERAGNTVIPLRSSLPERCFGVAEATGEIIVLTRGEMGYRPAGARAEGVSPWEAADAANEALGVTRAQAAAMLAGSLFGWDKPAADPKKYDQRGQPLRPRYRDRRDAR